MAPAIVHFLVGASLFLFLATPFALRSESVRRSRLWLVVLGGLWGLAPDLYNITPVFRDRVASLHDSSWADLFAFHYTLDGPPFADLYLESIFVAILLFLCTTLLFTAVGTSRETGYESRVDRFATAVLCLVLAAVVGAAAFGAVLYASGRLESVAALYGRESARAGATLLVVWGFATGTIIATILAVADGTLRATDPTAGVTVGLLVVIPGWVLGVALALPLYMRVVLDASRPIPYLHWQSLAGLLGFGIVFGLVYSLLRRFATPLATREREPPDSNTRR